MCTCKLQVTRKFVQEILAKEIHVTSTHRQTAETVNQAGDWSVKITTKVK